MRRISLQLRIPTHSDQNGAVASASDRSFQSLCESLGGPTFPCVIALVGGGGKTTTLFGVTRRLHAHGHRVVATTTTRMGASQTGGFAIVGTGFEDVLSGVSQHGAVVAVGTVHGQGDRPKVGGLSGSVIEKLFVSGHVDAIVIEADGSRRHNVKAPAHYEPVIPKCATHVVVVMGADALDRVIGDVAHRPDLLAAVVDARPTDILTAERAARLLTSESGSRKSVPAAARFTAVITKVTTDNMKSVSDVAERVRAQGFDVVLFPFDDNVADSSR